MTSIDYTYFYKQKFTELIDFTNDREYDIFISTFNESERVQKISQHVNAKEKHILLLPDYQNNLFVPKANDVTCHNIDHDNYLLLLDIVDRINIKDQTICIDITGFLIPQMLFLIRYLQRDKNIKTLDVIYTDPMQYKDGENTNFSDDFHEVSQIHGFGGVHTPDMTNDLLIIASGYDDSRIIDVANKKSKAKKVQLFGFPSVQADMFQENILKAYKAESALGKDSFRNLDLNLYSPANDPFVAAQTIKKFIQKEEKKEKITNIYLSPISSKPHALGMGLYYIWEGYEKPLSLLYPTCKKYYGNTCIGISKIWKYKVEFP